jgi:hypothetical protein
MKGNIVVYKRILYTVAILSVLIQLFCDFNIGLLEGGVENNIYYCDLDIGFDSQ